MEDWAGFAKVKETAVCKVCGHTITIAYTRITAHSDHFEVGQVPSMPLSFSTEVTYIECAKCKSAIYGIDGGWYPHLAAYQSRYRQRQEQPIVEKVIQPKKVFTSDILNAALAKLEGE